MSTNTASDAPALPPDSLQALIERDADGAFRRDLFADFDARLTQLGQVRSLSSSEDIEVIDQISELISQAKTAVDQVWSMYHGDA